MRNKKEITATANRIIAALQQELKNDLTYGLARETAIDLTSLVATIGQDRAEIFQWLKDCPNFDSSSYVREGAVEALFIVQGWKDDPDTLSWLKNLTQHDDSLMIRLIAVLQLAQDWKDNSDILPLIKYRAQHDDNEMVR